MKKNRGVITSILLFVTGILLGILLTQQTENRPKEELVSPTETPLENQEEVIIMPTVEPEPTPFPSEEPILPIMVDCLYEKNERMELGDYRFEENFIQSDNLFAYEYGEEVFFQGLSGNLLCYDGKETEVILNEEVRDFSFRGRFLTCLLQEKKGIVVLDLKNKTYNTFAYTFPFDEEDCYLPCLYSITNNSYQACNLTDKKYLYVLENGVYTDMSLGLSNTAYPLAAYFEIGDTIYYLENHDATCYLYENKASFDTYIQDLQVAGSTIYYLKNRNEYGGYLQENYLMKYDTESKEITQIVETPVISFFAAGSGIYYSLNPTCFKENPWETKPKDADALRMKENQGVYFLSNQGITTLITEELYSGFQVCQYGLLGITPREESVELHLIKEDETVMLDSFDGEYTPYVRRRWLYN